MTGSENETLITREEAARRAGVHVSTIRQWERAGKITVKRFKVGNRKVVRVPASALLEVIAERGGRVRTWDTEEWVESPEKLVQMLRKARRAANEARGIIDRLQAENRALRMQLEVARARNSELERRGKKQKGRR